MGQTQAALAAATEAPVSEAVHGRLQALSPRLRDSLASALEARIRDCATGLEKLLAEQRGERSP